MKVSHGHNLVEAESLLASFGDTGSSTKKRERDLWRLVTDSANADFGSLGLAVLHADLHCCEKLKPSSIAQDSEGDASNDCLSVGSIELSLQFTKIFK